MREALAKGIANKQVIAINFVNFVGIVCSVENLEYLEVDKMTNDNTKFIDDINLIDIELDKMIFQFVCDRKNEIVRTLHQLNDLTFNYIIESPLRKWEFKKIPETEVKNHDGFFTTDFSMPQDYQKEIRYPIEMSTYSKIDKQFTDFTNYW